MRVAGLFVTALLVVACGRTPARWDKRVPKLPFVEDEPPVRWPLRPIEPAPSPVDVSPLDVRADADGRVEVSAPRAPSFAYVGAPAYTRFEHGTNLDRGWMHRLAWLEPADQQRRLERYIELFRGSPIVSVFQRVHLARGLQPLLGHRFEVPAELDRMVTFDGNVAVRGPRREVTYHPERTTKPFVVLRNRADDRGIVFFFPHRPELRRWYVEDYVVTSSPAATIDATGSTVDVRFESKEIEPYGRRTFDFDVFAMPYSGTASAALDRFRLGNAVLSERPPGRDFPTYWPDEPWLEDGDRGIRAVLRMLRYFPTEFASWLDASATHYGHRGGYGWGVMTKQMKGIRLDPLHEQPLRRDHAFRMLAFFLEAGAKKGAPPNLTMHPQWSTQLADPTQIRDIVFCQYWEFRIGEFRRFFDSPYLQTPEAQQAYDDLQRARRVFDPDAKAFTTTTPNGGVWFDYLDVPIAAEQQWIINTHTTNIINVGELALLARDRGADDDFDYWRDLFVRGLDGQDWALSRGWLWAEEDKNLLKYSRFTVKPKKYHFFMTTAWIPHVIRIARELAPDRVDGLVALLDRLASADYITSDPELAEPVTEAVESAHR